MNRIVQITGLPRSGTAFMAAFSMLHPAANVFHENIADGGDWRGRLKDSVRDFPLTVDCGTYQYFSGAVFPGATKIFLGRNVEESAKSAAKAAGRIVTSKDIADSVSLFHASRQWRLINRPFEIQFGDLFKEATLGFVWGLLDPSVSYPFPAEKVRQLIRMRIVRKDIEKFSAENVAKNGHELFQPWD